MRARGLLAAYLRRMTPAGGQLPEPLDLKEVFLQQWELLQAEETVPPDLRLDLDPRAPLVPINGVYADFAEAFSQIIRHASTSPSTTRLKLDITMDGVFFRLDFEDDGGPLDPHRIELAFDPLQTRMLDGHPAGGVRQPGPGLPIASQQLNPYNAKLSLENLAHGSRLRLLMPRDGT